jgi:uncharacterized protein (DUF885 family)
MPAVVVTCCPMTTVAEVSERYVRDSADLDPIWALFSGVEADARLSDQSPAGHQARADLARRVLRSLSSAEVVDEAGRLGRVFLEDQLRGELALHEAGEHERNVSELFGPQAYVRQVFDLLPQSDETNWEVLAECLAQVPRAMGEYRTTLEAGLAAGRTASARLAGAVASQCEVWAGEGNGGWFATLAHRYGEGPLAARLLSLSADAATSYRELAEWFRRYYLPRASDEDGVGEERYPLWARHTLGSELDLEDAYNWGWEELARLEAEKSVEASRVSRGASCDEAVALLKKEGAHGVEGVDAWRAWLQDLTDQTIAFLNGTHFDITEPLLRCAVSVPPEGTAAAPYYTPPAADFSRPGQVWFPTVGRTWFPTWDLMTTIYHEAVPGHHLQLGLTRLLPLTRAQQVGISPAHAEGWALYAERFMDELGKFEKPEFRLGFLSMQAFRAARVVVDIGLHTGRRIPSGWPAAGERWNYDLAVEYIEKASGLDRDFCESEVLRYLSLPSQATCYKLGERVWLEAREQAKRQANGAWSLKRWHNRALALGPLGLGALRKELVSLAGDGR